MKEKQLEELLYQALETELGGCLGVAFELVEIGVAARELDMPGGHELAVRADELTQPTPDLA